MTSRFSCKRVTEQLPESPLRGPWGCFDEPRVLAMDGVLELALGKDFALGEMSKCCGKTSTVTLAS